MTIKIYMHIGERRPNSHHNDTDEFEPLVSIDMGKVEGGDLLQLTNTPSGQKVRLYDRGAAKDRPTEIQTNMYGVPLVAVDAGTVFSTIKADISKRHELGSNLHYRLAMINLDTLAKTQPAAEVVFESYADMRMG